MARGRVPFLIENYPYVDPHGREAVSFVRTFAVGSRQHRFDATMVYCDRRGAVVDYLGAHHDFGVDLSFTALPDGALQIRTSGFRVYAGPIAGTLPAVLTGRALVRESFDEAIGCFRIDVRVTNPVVGPLFGYEGRFSMRSVDADRLPSQVRPVRAERRM